MSLGDIYKTVVRKHLTKVLGFAQVTVGVFALNAEELFGKHGAKWVLIASGLLTAWRGFWVSNFEKETGESVAASDPLKP